MFILRPAFIVFAMIGLLIASGCCHTPAIQPAPSTRSAPATTASSAVIPADEMTVRMAFGHSPPPYYQFFRQGVAVYIGSVDHREIQSPPNTIERGLAFVTVTSTLRGPAAKTLKLHYSWSAMPIYLDYVNYWPTSVLMTPGTEACFLFQPDPNAPHVMSSAFLPLVLPAGSYAGDPPWGWMKKLCQMDESFGKPESAKLRLDELIKATDDPSPAIRRYADQALLAEYVDSHPQQVADVLLRQVTNPHPPVDGISELPTILRQLGSKEIGTKGQTSQEEQKWAIQTLVKMASIQPATAISRQAFQPLAISLASQFPPYPATTTSRPATQQDVRSPNEVMYAIDVLNAEQITTLRASLDAIDDQPDVAHANRVIRRWLEVTTGPHASQVPASQPFKPRESAALMHSMVGLADFYDLQRSRCYVYVGKIENAQGDHIHIQYPGISLHGTTSVKVNETIHGPQKTALLVDYALPPAFFEINSEVLWLEEVLKGEVEACFFILPAGTFPNGPNEHDEVVAILPARKSADGNAWGWLHKIVQLDEDIRNPNAALHRHDDLIRATTDPSPHVRHYADTALVKEYFSIKSPASVDAMVKQLSDPRYMGEKPAVGPVVLHWFGNEVTAANQTPPARIQLLQVLCRVNAARPATEISHQATLSLAQALDAPFPPAPRRPSFPKTSPPIDFETWKRSLPPIPPPNPPLSEAYPASEVLPADQIQSLRASLKRMDDDPEVAQARGIIQRWVGAAGR